MSKISNASAPANPPGTAGLDIEGRGPARVAKAEDPGSHAYRAEAVGAKATGASALAAFAVGALAIGALAIGALAIGRLRVGRARFQRLEIDELIVRKHHGPDSPLNRRR